MRHSHALHVCLLSLAFLPWLEANPSSLADEPLPSSIVDTHVHLWDLSRPEGIYWISKDNKTLYQNMLPELHQEIAKQNGVTGVVVVQAGQSLPDNQWNLDITRHNPKLYQGVVGNLSEVIGTDKFKPLFLTLCKDPRYVGYRLSGRYQDKLSDAFFRDLELTAQHGKTVDFLVGGYTLDDVTAIAKRVPQLKIMLDHFGGVKLSKEPLAGTWIESFQQAAKCPNVYCKVSALYGRFEQQPAPKDRSMYEPILTLALKCFGEDRIVFGSDWPVTRTTGDYQSVLDLTHSFFDDHAPGAVEKLFSQNAKKFYGLD
jgi:L-fuconolactonase